MSSEPQEPRTDYRDHRVLDDRGSPVGTVTDVIFDDRANQPAWLVVKPGVLRSERYVPIDGSYTSEGGDVIVPFDRRSVTRAPKARHHHVLSSTEAAELKRHYGQAG